ncbi:ABC transporter permease [Reticulibacter mediterranei]|uniref:ABC transporter permease n=1 Tax=Reticulibacter mediterranei TaxID=2778369 RepID=A0A8J3IJT7_9CHLR|nr:ABC transporter permease [Reticulibacter mediterranei]GHO95043.1 ABC transporter permease [Reticulibacter mediterranei]
MSTQRRTLRFSWQRLSRSQRGTLLAYVAVIVLFIVGGIYRPGFVRLDNIGQLLLLASFVGLVAAGQTFVILIGGIDLSVPWVLNAMAVLLTTTSLGQDSRAWWVVPLVLVLGAVIGAVNGLGIVFFDIPPVVMTLGMNGIMQGLVLGLTGGFTCATCNSVAPPAVQTAIAGQAVLGLPNGLLVWIIVALLVGLVLSATTLGRRIYALGNNAVAAYLAGVNVRAVTFIVYALGGLFAALAGIALTAFGQQATLGMGDPFLFDSIAAVVIGGTSILGGRGNYWGSIAGAIFLVVLRAVLQQYSISEAGRSIVTGVVILVALLLYGREAREV